MKEIEFKLETPINYADQNAGCHVDALHLTLCAPTVSMIKQTSIIKNIFFKGMNQNKSEITEKESEEIKRSGQIPEINAEMIEYLVSSNPNLDAIINAFKELCVAVKGGVVKMPDGSKITPYLLDEMSTTDFEKMMGVYIQNFIVGSLLNRMKTL